MKATWWWSRDGAQHLSPDSYLVMEHMISEGFPTLCGLIVNWSTAGMNSPKCFRCLVEDKARNGV